MSIVDSLSRKARLTTSGKTEASPRRILAERLQRQRKRGGLIGRAPNFARVREIAAILPRLIVFDYWNEAYQAGAGSHLRPTRKSEPRLRSWQGRLRPTRFSFTDVCPTVCRTPTISIDKQSNTVGRPVFIL